MIKINDTITFNGILEPNDVLIIDTCSRQVLKNGINVLNQISGSFLDIDQLLNQILYQDNEQSRLVEVSLTYLPQFK